MSSTNSSMQTLEQFRLEVQNESREIDLKAAELKRKEDEIAKKKSELQKLENDAAGIKHHVEELKTRRTSNEQKIKLLQQELQKLIGKK